MIGYFFLAFWLVWFAYWNSHVARHVLITLRRSLNDGKCFWFFLFLIILLIPNIFFGIFIPFALVTFLYGLRIGFVFACFSGLLPYIYWLIRIGSAQHDFVNGHSMPCWGLYSGEAADDDDNNDDDNNDNDAGNQRGPMEFGIIFKSVVEEDSSVSDTQYDDDDCEDGSYVLSFTPKEPKSDIVKRKRKKKKSNKSDDDVNHDSDSNSDSNSKNNNNNGKSTKKAKTNKKQVSTEVKIDEESLRPSTPLEEGEIELNNDNIETEEIKDEESCTLNLEGTSNSLQMCIICLGEYEVGDEIAWSGNDACHHVFHKECILEWLGSNGDSCPICRNKY